MGDRREAIAKEGRMNYRERQIGKGRNRCSDRMCGALDCGNCYPGADTPVICKKCDDGWGAWEAEEHGAEIGGEYHCFECIQRMIDLQMEALFNTLGDCPPGWLDDDEKAIKDALEKALWE